MSKEPSSSTIDQTALGHDNIQVIGSNNAITRVTKLFAGDVEARRTLRNRRSMLELVKNTWIKGVLEKSLYKEVLIKLGMEERFSAVQRPWDIQIQIPNKENRALPAGTSILQVFDEMNGGMLILGDPGSGKTTMMLELARECIARAERDDSQPIPVVFNLSSWDRTQTIDTWLESELNTKYNVPKKIARTWIKNDDLHLLLDGLDEIKEENREAGVRAINDFRQDHGLTVPITVCSRINDYETIVVKLNLSGAVILQPLTSTQINEYFNQAGVELEGMREALINDKVLQELVKQPLMLSVMTLAYQGKPINVLDIEDLESVEAQRKHLFDAYIERMFDGVVRTKREAYTQEQTKRWLAWLAQAMLARGHTVFFIDQIYLLLKPSTQVFSQRIIAPIILGLLISGNLIGILLGSVSPEVFFIPGFLVLITSIFLVIVNIVIYIRISKHAYTSGNEEKVKVYDVLGFSWMKSLPGIISGWILGAIAFLFFPALFMFFVFGLSNSFGLGLISGLILKEPANLQVKRVEENASKSALTEFFSKKTSVLNAFILTKLSDKRERKDNQLNKPTELLRWSWRRALHGLVVGLSIGLITGLIVGITTGLIYASLLADLPDIGFRLGFTMGFTYGPFAGFFFMLFLGLIGFVLYGLNKDSLENQSYPNQVIRQSIISAGVAVLLIGVAFAVFGSVVSLLIFSLATSILAETNTVISFVGFAAAVGLAFIVGILIGGIFSLYYGGYAVMYHYCIRLILSHSDKVPWKLIPFLDYCVDRIFLRRVGGGYIFIHRLLMEHFAAMYSEYEKPA